MIWWIISSVLVLTFLAVLFAPLKISINTSQNSYFVSFGGFAKVSATLATNDITLQYYLFGFGRKVSLLELLAGVRAKKSVPERFADLFVKSTKKNIPQRLICDVVKSFCVKKLDANIDFGSVYANAWLFPLGEIFSRKNLTFSTNFEGKLHLELLITNRPINLIWAVVKSHFKNKK